MWVLVVGLVVLVVSAFWRVHLWQVVGSLGIQDLPEVGSGPLVVRSLPFVRSLALPLVHRLQMWFYLAF